MRTRVQGPCIFFLDYTWKSISGKTFTLFFEDKKWYYVPGAPLNLYAAVAMAGRVDEEEMLVMKLTYGA